MNLREQIAADAAVFVNPEEFGQTVKLWLDDGTSVQLNAVVDLQAWSADSNLQAATLTSVVHLPVAQLPRIPKAGDYIELSMLPGEPAARVRIEEILSVDEGICDVRLEA